LPKDHQPPSVQFFFSMCVSFAPFFKHLCIFFLICERKKLKYISVHTDKMEDSRGKLSIQCNRELSSDDFHRDTQHPSGSRKECKDCRKANAQRNWQGRILGSSAWADEEREHVVNNPLTVEWLDQKLEELAGRCFYCKCRMEYGEGKSRQGGDGLTIERIDKHKGHGQDNCTLACFVCNSRTKGEKGIPIDLMIEFGSKLKSGELLWCPGQTHLDLRDHVQPPTKFVRRRASLSGYNTYCRECVQANMVGQGKCPENQTPAATLNGQTCPDMESSGAGEIEPHDPRHLTPHAHTNLPDGMGLPEINQKTTTLAERERKWFECLQEASLADEPLFRSTESLFDTDSSAPRVSSYVGRRSQVQRKKNRSGLPIRSAEEKHRLRQEKYAHGERFCESTGCLAYHEQGLAKCAYHLIQQRGYNRKYQKTQRECNKRLRIVCEQQQAELDRLRRQCGGQLPRLERQD
jgi:hypothetical protein